MASEPSRRLVFEDFWQGEGPSTAAVRRVTPISEAASATSGQVHAERPGRGQGEFLAIDSLAAHPSITSVVASGLVTTATPLPSVQELFVLSYGDRLTSTTADNLPHLKRLFVSRPDTHTLLRAPELVDLVCHQVDNIEALPELGRLQRLKIGREVIRQSVELLAGLGELRWLHLIAWKGWRGLGLLTKLERLEADAVSMSNLRGWRALRELRSLSLGGNLASLDGIEVFAHLETLSLGIDARVDLRPITLLTELREITVGGDTVAPETLHVVGGLAHLRRFSLGLGDIRSSGRLPSIGFLEGLAELEAVELRNVHLEDARLDPLFELPRLRTVTLTGDAGPDVEELRRRRPDVEVRTHLTGEPAGRVRVGSIVIDRIPVSGQWSIFQDLTGLLGTETNGEAEAHLRSLLRTADPALLDRLAFDSEAGAVGIYAGTEEDIRAAAEHISRLARSTGPS